MESHLIALGKYTYSDKKNMVTGLDSPSGVEKYMKRSSQRWYLGDKSKSNDVDFQEKWKKFNKFWNASDDKVRHELTWLARAFLVGDLSSYSGGDIPEKDLLAEACRLFSLDEHIQVKKINQNKLRLV